MKSTKNGYNSIDDTLFKKQFHRMSKDSIENLINSNLDFFNASERSGLLEMDMDLNNVTIQDLFNDWKKFNTKIQKGKNKKEYARELIKKLKGLHDKNGNPLINRNSTYGLLLYSKKNITLIDDMGHNFGDDMLNIRENCKLLNCIFLQSPPLDLIGFFILELKIDSGDFKVIYFDWDDTLSLQSGFRGPEKLTASRSLYDKEVLAKARKSDNFRLTSKENAYELLDELFENEKNGSNGFLRKRDDLKEYFFGSYERQKIIEYIFNKNNTRHIIISSNPFMLNGAAYYRALLFLIGVDLEQVNKIVCRYSPWSPDESSRKSLKMKIIKESEKL